MKFLIVWLILFPVTATAQEVLTEFPAEEEKKLEWSGNLDAKYAWFHMSKGSPLYRLQFFNEEISAYASQYRIEPYLNADYQTQDMGFHLKTHATYFSDNNASFDIFEAYGNFNPSFNFTIQAGKRVYNWGKGYAFNPVGYVNPVKDAEIPELAQAGLLSASFEYVKSFSSTAFQTLSILVVAIPPIPNIANRYAEADNIDVAARVYVLFWDTDIDVMGLYRKNDRRQIGFDVSRNVRENIEVHAEVSYSEDFQRHSIENGSLRVSRESQRSYLVGLRYLHESNTTLIAEYYRNGSGLTGDEYNDYFDFLASAANSGNGIAVQQALAVNQRYFRGSTLMRDYLYARLIVPEPFDWLYFTPSFSCIYNVNDGSFLASASFSYKPVTNVEFIVWPTILGGAKASEFGGRMIEQRIEAWFRVFF